MYNSVIAGYTRSPFTMARKGALIDVKPVNLLSEEVSPNLHPVTSLATLDNLSLPLNQHGVVRHI